LTRFAVVICAHDSRRWTDLRAAVGAVERQTLPAEQVVVVVDGNDELLHLARGKLDGVDVVENSEHPGLGGARNSGIAAAAAPVVAFLDDDAVVTERWLELLSGPYADPEVAGVGGSIEPRWQTRRPPWFPPEFDWVVGCTFRGMPERTDEVRNLIGCNMSYRRDLLVELDGFRLGYGCDETELCIRLRQRWPQKRLVYVPEAAASHYVPDSRATFSRYLSRCFFEGGSKAVVSHFVGRERGLASEREHALRTLPRGVWEGLADLVREGDRSGPARSAAIVAGLAATVAGYAKGRLTLTTSAERRGWTGN
jgi:cellulose synthase/poly-beta-1,6-N-acetylglucosamine synthase-like glycosyltransferase